MSKFAGGFVILLLLLSVAGCGGNDSTATPVPSASPTSVANSTALPSVTDTASAGNTPTSVPGSTEHEVTYSGAGGAQLSGTLLLPAPQPGQKLPAVIIVAGSGPTDRNGNSTIKGATNINIYKQFAEALAAHGVASLRYDKRGIGKSQPYPTPTDPKNPTAAEKQALADYFAWQNFVDDAAATFAYLQQQPEIDPARTGMLGHSEGGYLVLQAAATGKGFTNPPAVLILASTPGRSYDVVIHEQIVNLLKKQGANATQTPFYVDATDRIIAAIKQTGQVPTDVPQGLAPLFPSYLGKFYQQAFQNDPAKYAAQFPGPVLVIEGALDDQVFPAADTPLLDAALKTRHPDDHEVFIVPGAGHELKPITSANPTGLNGDVDPAALDKLGTWTAGKLHVTGRLEVKKRGRKVSASLLLFFSLLSILTRRPVVPLIVGWVLHCVANRIVDGIHQ